MLQAGIDERGCVLCGHLNLGACDIQQHVEESQHTFADVLEKLFLRSSSDEDLNHEHSFEEGKLCTICKGLLETIGLTSFLTIMFCCSEVTESIQTSERVERREDSNHENFQRISKHPEGEKSGKECGANYQRDEECEKSL